MGQQHGHEPANTSAPANTVNDSSDAPDKNTVEILPIVDLLSHPLTIPDYQRPYTWGISNMRQLIEDIRLFMN
ncbi:MAG: DUF262 domain-containing protein, partial [Bifidobacterium sp.]|nr:DUF262 domain-containing protein [Bifidobacterium sp.]